VLELAVLADDGTLAVRLDVADTTEQGHQTFRQVGAETAELGHERH